MSRPSNGSKKNDQAERLDDAARAGWLYYIAGNTQDEIARKMNVSRPTAQRLVSLALSERLITFRLDHPIAACMELARRMTDRFQLAYCDIVPTDPKNPANVNGAAASLAGFLEQKLAAANPIIIAVGTGRMLRAAVDQVRPTNAPHHQLVSLVGNIAPDGSASFFDALTRLADLTRARHYPLPLPLLAASRKERDLLLSIEPFRHVHELAGRADVTVVGIGQMDMEAQVFVDGFLSRDQLLDLMGAGAVGEVVGWAFDKNGVALKTGTNLRITSAPLTAGDGRLVVGAALGPGKVNAIRAALAGRQVTGLVTDEATATALLSTG